MRKHLLIVAASLTVAAPFARAQAPQVVAEARGPGVGIEQNLGGLTGATFSYDAGRFHVDVIAGFVHYSNDGPNNDETDFGIGGRFFFKLHEMAGADFSIGGGIGILRTDIDDNGDTAIQIEGAAQIRVFPVPNVALTGSLGLVLMTADDFKVTGGPIAGGGTGNSIWGFGGQLLSAFGVIYYFH